MQKRSLFRLLILERYSILKSQDQTGQTRS